ncbi:MAG: tetratricopeptide repeat protein [Pseudomonadota bacterium]
MIGEVAGNCRIGSSISTMHTINRFLITLILGISSTLAAASDIDALRQLAGAEDAMRRGDYAAAVDSYVSAAEAGAGMESARQATITAFEFGFDEQTVRAAAAWRKSAKWPDDADTYAAMALTRAGNVDPAIKRFTALFGKTSDPDAICDLAEEGLIRETRAQHLDMVFSRLAKKFKSTPCVLRIAATGAVALEEYERADTYFAQLRNLKAFGNDARLLAIARYVRDEKTDQAFTDPLLRLDDEATVKQQIELAALNATAEDNQNALNMLLQLQAENPKDGDVLEALALAQLQAGEAEASRATLTQLLGSGKKTSSALFYLARFAESERRVDQALRMYSQVDSGDLVVAAQQRAAALIRQQDGLPAALQHIDDFVERHPRYGLSLSVSRASLYAAGEYYDQALSLYDDYLLVKPKAEFAMLARADVLLRSDNLDGALDAFRGVVKSYPESSSALNALGYTLADRTKKYREAERLIDKALDKDPENAAIIDSKGWVLYKRGKLKQAREYLEKAWEQYQDAEVAAHLGEVMWRMGEEDEARKLLEEAYRRAPDDDVLRETIRRLMEDGPATRS